MMAVNPETLRLWVEAKKALEYWKNVEDTFRTNLFNEAFPDKSQCKEGANYVELPNGRLKFTLNNNYKLDEFEKVLPALGEIERTRNDESFVQKLVKWSGTVSASTYRELTADERKIFDRVLTIKPGKPQVEFKNTSLGE